MKQYEEIKPLPALFRLFEVEKLRELEFDATEVPMLVPPIPWISTKEGGYLLRGSRFVRLIGKTFNVFYGSVVCHVCVY